MEFLEDGCDGHLGAWELAGVSMPDHEVAQVGLRKAAALGGFEVVHSAVSWELGRLPRAVGSVLIEFRVLEFVGIVWQESGAPQFVSTARAARAAAAAEEERPRIVGSREVVVSTPNPKPPGTPPNPTNPKPSAKNVINALANSGYK